jgi:hypothetical protein
MAYVSLFRRPAAVFLLSLSLTACSTDDLTPPGRIDQSARVSAIEPVNRHARGSRENPYPAANTPLSTFSENSDDTVPADPSLQASSQRLPRVSTWTR